MSKRLMLFEFLIWSKDKGGRVPRAPPPDPPLNRVAKWAIFVLNRVRVWSPRRHSSTETSPESAPPPHPDWGSPTGFFNPSFRPLFSLNPPSPPNDYFRHSGAFHAYSRPSFCLESPNSGLQRRHIPKRLSIHVYCLYRWNKLKTVVGMLNVSWNRRPNWGPKIIHRGKTKP